MGIGDRPLSDAKTLFITLDIGKKTLYLYQFSNNVEASHLLYYVLLTPIQCEVVQQMYILIYSSTLKHFKYK